MVLDGVLRYVMAFDIQFAHAFFADIYNNLHPPGNIANDEPRKIAEEAWVDGDLSSIDSFDGCDRSMSAIDGCENEIPSTVPTRGSSYGVDDRRDFDVSVYGGVIRGSENCYVHIRTWNTCIS